MSKFFTTKKIPINCLIRTTHHKTEGLVGLTHLGFVSVTHLFHPLGLHELDAINDQEVKDFRSKMFRISEEKMQRVQMMTCAEWLQACFSPQLEPAAATAITDQVNDRPPDLKVIIHFDQSQVSFCIPSMEMLHTLCHTQKGVTVCVKLQL